MPRCHPFASARWPAEVKEDNMFIDEAALAAARRGVPDGAFHSK